MCDAKYAIVQDVFIVITNNNRYDFALKRGVWVLTFILS